MAAPISTFLPARTAMRQSSRPPDGEGPNTSLQQLAWRREMERAQLGDWFRSAPQNPPSEHQPRGGRAEPAVDERAPATKTVGVPVAEPRLGGASRPLSAAGRAGGAATALAADVLATTMHALAPPPDDVMDRSVSPGIQHREASLSPRRGAVDAAGRGPAIASPNSPAPERQSMSVHTELAPAGLAVWLGMHEGAPPLEAMLPALVADLQRGLEDRGQRLYQVVCNGRLVWRDGHSVGEFSTIYSKEP